jgi:V-type H+-transporting ATPase subunit a
VNTYGIPRYKEINPGFFTLITFPFMFGVMFGDIAHGGLLLTFGLFLIFKEDSLKNSPIFSIMLPFRYLLALMGFFACYCGFIYNDFTSISLDIFGSCYEAS